MGGEAPSVYRVARTEKEGSDKRKSVIEILEKKDGRRKGCGHPDHASSEGEGGRSAWRPELQNSTIIKIQSYSIMLRSYLYYRWYLVKRKRVEQSRVRQSRTPCSFSTLLFLRTLFLVRLECRAGWHHHLSLLGSPQPHRAPTTSQQSQCALDRTQRRVEWYHHLPLLGSHQSHRAPTRGNLSVAMVARSVKRGGTSICRCLVHINLIAR